MEKNEKNMEERKIFPKRVDFSDTTSKYWKILQIKNRE